MPCMQNTQTHIHRKTDIHIFTHIHTYAYTHIHKNIHLHTCTQTSIQTHIYIHTACTYTHKLLYINTYT